MIGSEYGFHLRESHAIDEEGVELRAAGPDLRQIVLRALKRGCWQRQMRGSNRIETTNMAVAPLLRSLMSGGCCANSVASVAVRICSSCHRRGHAGMQAEETSNAYLG